MDMQKSPYQILGEALQETGAEEELTQMLKEPLFRIADAIRNREGPSARASNPDILASH